MEGVAQTSQEFIVKGKIIGAEVIVPLIGVTSIDVNDTTHGVVSDFDGNYEIKTQN